MEIAVVSAIPIVRKEMSFDTLSPGANTLSDGICILSNPARTLSDAIYMLSWASGTLSSRPRWAKNDNCTLSADGRKPSSAFNRLSGASHRPFCRTFTLSNPSNSLIHQ